jgi:uncharacterized protein YggU (UPF0235/DUF167 family)
VRLTPRGGRDALEGLVELADGRTALKARVRAAPAAGAANLALETLIAEKLGMPRSAVTLIAGGKGRLKTLAITGDAERLAEALGRLFE